MKQLANMHRPSSVIAAVLMILSQVLKIAASLATFGDHGTSLVLIELIGNALITVLLAATLFRGRKDAFAGVAFLLTAIVPVLSVADQSLLLLMNAGSTFYILLCALSGLLLAAFRGLAAVECLGKGRISAGGGRALLWLLPILCFFVELCAQMLLEFCNGVTDGKMFTGSLIYITPQWLGPILMGVSLSVPGKREDC